MAQIRTCSAPTITARPACGGVVSFSLSAPPSLSATYAWTLGNGQTASGYGPINAVCASAGPFHVTLQVVDGRCKTTSTLDVTPDLGGGCCPAGIAAGNLLGAAGQTTTLSGGGYQRTVTGSTITVGTNAALVLDNATLTAAGSGTDCAMWGGVVLDSQGQGPGGPYRLEVKNSSVIRHALCAVKLADDTRAGAMAYRLDHATFSDNLNHVQDVGHHDSNQLCLITNCRFESQARQMHFPYDQTTANDGFYTYQALELKPSGGYSKHAVEVRGNTIEQAVYGINSSFDDCWGVAIHDNYLNKIFQTGIWTANTDTGAGSLPTVSGNTVASNTLTPQNSEQIDPNSILYSILGERPGPRNAYVSNALAADNGSSATNNSKPQVGLSISGPTDASGNSFSYFGQGIQTAELDGSVVFDNLLDRCASGFVVQPSPNGTYQLDRLGCNTFQGQASAPGGYGIVVQQDAVSNDIGSNGSPAANRFENLGASVINLSSNTVNYYYTGSMQEPVNLVSPGNVQFMYAPVGNLTGYCQNQGAGNGNGVNQRTTTLSPAYVAALMDSVRLQLVPPVRQNDYLATVHRYHAATQQLAALETWWATLAAPNAGAFRTTGRYLLQAYDRQHSPAAAQRVLAGLQPAALADAELAAQLGLRAVLRKLPAAWPGVSRADSAALRTLAWSGTGAAASAGRWLRYFYPRVPLPPQVLPTLALQRPLAARLRPRLPGGASLGAAFPNPARTEALIACQLPAAQAGQAAELRFTDLLSGRVVLAVPVAGAGTERSQSVPLAGLTAGQYAYQLVVAEVPVAGVQKLIVQP